MGSCGAVCKLRWAASVCPPSGASPLLLEGCFQVLNKPWSRACPDSRNLSPLKLYFQAEGKAVLSCLRKLFRSPTLSARDVHAAAGEQSGDPRPPACPWLIRRLTLNFLLWAPGGHAIAREVISLVSLPFSSFLDLIHIPPDGPASEECVPGCCPDRWTGSKGEGWHRPQSLPHATGSEKGGDLGHVTRLAARAHRRSEVPRGPMYSSSSSVHDSLPPHEEKQDFSEKRVCSLQWFKECHLLITKQSFHKPS